MCLIIVKQKNAKVRDSLSDKELNKALATNPHGVGISYVSDKNEVVNFRMLKVNESEFAEIINFVDQDCKGQTVVIHLRFTSAGETSLENCHPHPLPGGGMLSHNGHIRGFEYDTKKSDTRSFIDDVLAKTDSVIWPALLQATGSKYAIHWPSGKVKMIGDFTRRGGLFLSNTYSVTVTEYPAAIGCNNGIYNPKAGGWHVAPDYGKNWRKTKKGYVYQSKPVEPVAPAPAIVVVHEVQSEAEKNDLVKDIICPMPSDWADCKLNRGDYIDDH